ACSFCASRKSCALPPSKTGPIATAKIITQSDLFVDRVCGNAPPRPRRSNPVTLEKMYNPISGFIGLAFSLLLMAASLWLVIYAGTLFRPSMVLILVGAAGILLGFIGLFGLMAIAPNQARVLLLFGEYKG